MSEHDSSKRSFIKAAAYVAPVVLTLKASPSLAGLGSYTGSELDSGGGSGLGNGAAPLLGFSSGPKHRRNSFLARARHNKAHGRRRI